jgi:hypothetical protein
MSSTFFRNHSICALVVSCGFSLALGTVAPGSAKAATNVLKTKKTKAAIRNKQASLKAAGGSGADQLEGSQSIALSASSTQMEGSTEKKADEIVAKKSKSSIGLSYFSFFAGPGLTAETAGYTPNERGLPDWTGYSLFNVISIRTKITEKINLDLQTRSNITFNDYVKEGTYRLFTWESPRIGISGKLLSGENWSLTGAFNTDFPYVLPTPLTGYTARNRTTLFTPGTFANFFYQKKGSRWSVFSIVSPRFFVYSDRMALEPEAIEGGMNPNNKLELALAVSPTLNYSFTENLSASVGSGFQYTKQVGDSWNMFNASLVANSKGDEWHVEAIPLTAGVTYTSSEALSVFPYIQVFPIAAQRVNANTGNMASFLSTASVGMWINGSLY